MEEKKVIPLDQLTVGADVNSKCGACKEVTKHLVVAMGEKKPAKVKCTICDRSHQYRAPAKPKAARATKKNVEAEEWARLSQKWDETKAVPYGMNKVFKNGVLVKHAKFGVGVVVQILEPNKMRVLFETGIKLMVCSTKKD